MFSMYVILCMEEEMKKKIIPIVLMLILVFSSTSYAFSDISEHWAKDSIDE